MVPLWWLLDEFMYSFFYGTFTRASTNNLDSTMNCTFHAGGSRRKGNKLKRRRERERKARQNESEKEELEVRIIA